MSPAVDDGTWRLLTDPVQFSEIAQDWQRLYFSNPVHSPFQAWGWVAAWLKHLAGPHEMRILTWQTSDGELQLIVPLISIGSNFFATERLVLAGSYGPDCSDYLGFLYHPSLESRLADLVMQGFCNMLPPDAAVCFEPVSRKTSVASRLAEIAARNGRRSRISRQLVCPRTQLAESWDAYLTTLSSNFRSQVRRHYRRVLNDDTVHFRQVPAADAKDFTAKLVALNRARIAAKGDTSSLEDRQFREFMLEAVPFMATEGLAWMDVIEDSNRILGATLNFVHGSVVYYYMGGFEERAARLRPGTALFAQVIQRSIDEGYLHYDFLRGEESYKYRWGACDEVLERMDIYPSGVLRGTAIWLCDGGISLLRNKMRSLPSRKET